MTKGEWKYLKTLDKGRKLEAYQSLPLSKPFWKQPTITVLLIYFIIILFLKLILKYHSP